MTGRSINRAGSVVQVVGGRLVDSVYVVGCRFGMNLRRAGRRRRSRRARAAAARRGRPRSRPTPCSEELKPRELLYKTRLSRKLGVCLAIVCSNFDRIGRARGAHGRAEHPAAVRAREARAPVAHVVLPARRL